MEPVHIIKDVLASCVGSAACVYSGQPFDTIKVRMQVQPGEFKNAYHCFQRTFSGEGITALWRGSVPAFIGALSENAVAFAINGSLKRLMNILRGSKEGKSSYEPYLCGGLTGTCTAVVLCPCDVIKCRAQLSRAQGKEASLKEIFAQTIKKQGYRGLYTGFSCQVLRDVPFYASFFGSYEAFCTLFKKNTGWSDPTIYFVSGGLAGQIAWILSIAPDSVKSKIQTSFLPTGISTTARQIMSEQGIRGFFIGIEVAVIRAFPSNAALFVGYELTRSLLD